MVRKLSVCAAMGMVLAFGSQAAAQCLPTGFVRDGIVMTAARINPPAVSGEVDASGCHIGVYYDHAGAGGTVSEADIHGATYFGVLVNGDSGAVNVDVRNSTIHDIGETPFNGSQHGVAVYYRALGAGTAEGDVDGNVISAYQKGGIVVNGARAWVNTLGNSVTGLGRVSFIAQNGIQYGFGANGTIFGNEIAGNFYTGDGGVGPNAGGQNPPGWDYVSAGLLLYQTGTVKQSKNMYRDNQRNVLMVQ